MAYARNAWNFFGTRVSVVRRDAIYLLVSNHLGSSLNKKRLAEASLVEQWYAMWCVCSTMRCSMQHLMRDANH